MRRSTATGIRGFVAARGRSLFFFATRRIYEAAVDRASDGADRECSPRCMFPDRRLSVGAEAASDGVHFRVYAPKRQRVAIVLDDREVALGREEGGHFAALAPGVRPGARYRVRLDDDDVRPDPASRFQPDGPHGPSEVVDPRPFRWTDRDWPGVEL